LTPIDPKTIKLPRSTVASPRQNPIDFLRFGEANLSSSERSLPVGGIAKPLRIALMVSGAGINGAIVHALLLTRYLGERGHHVLLLHRPGAWIAQQSGLDKAELFATSFGRSPGELIRVTQRLNALPT
jgi:hypothetical protein